MKNLMLTLFVMVAMVFSTNLSAQTACTPAQKAACKKICADKTACTPAQLAACKKTCQGKAKTSTASAVKVVNKAPSKTATCQPHPACNKTNATAVNSSPFKLVGLDLPSEKKKTDCSKTCTGKSKSKE